MHIAESPNSPVQPTVFRRKGAAAAQNPSTKATWPRPDAKNSMSVLTLCWSMRKLRASQGDRLISSAGRAPASHAGGRRFDPVISHQLLRDTDESPADAQR